VRAADARRQTQQARSELSAIVLQASSLPSGPIVVASRRAAVEQQLARSELLYRGRDFARAIEMLSGIIEEFPDTPSFPEALWLRGESYFAQDEYLSARRDFQQLMQRRNEPRFAPYLGRVVGRQIDVAIRIQDFASLKEISNVWNEVPSSQVDASFLYAKGKALFFQSDLTRAEQTLQAVPLDSEFAHASRYFLAMAFARRERSAFASRSQGPSLATENRPPVDSKLSFAKAIGQFRIVTALPADTQEHKKIIDLSWMAIGRLYYELENYVQAAESYGKLTRESSEFNTMLFELAWTYVRLGDVQRAERALELLSAADPESQSAGDGALLRADLLLRAGAFEKSRQLYQDVRALFEPMRVRMDSFIAKNAQSHAYVDTLAQQDLDILATGEHALPPLAIRWAREADDGPAAYATVEDLKQCRAGLDDSVLALDKITATLKSANRVRAFAEIRSAEEQILSLLNRIANVRLTVARALDSEESDRGSAEFESIRARRRKYHDRVSKLPVSSTDFVGRDERAQLPWDRVSQDVSRRVAELDYLEAAINGLRRMRQDESKRGKPRSADAPANVEAELARHERAIRDRRQRVAQLRRQVDLGRSQIGLGDARYKRDALARLRFRDALDEELRLVARGAGGASAQALAADAKAVLGEARRAEEALDARFAELERDVAARADQTLSVLEAERERLHQLAVTLEAYEATAREVVGKVAERNLTTVRDKVQALVLRADVGLTEHAWELREEQLHRVRRLQRARSRQEQQLDDERREILDESGGAAGAAGRTEP